MLKYLQLLKDWGLKCSNSAYRRLDAKNRKLNRFFYSSTDLMMIIRKVDGTVLEINDGWNHILNGSPRSLIGQSVFDIGFFADKNRLRECVGVDGGNKYGSSFEIPVICSSGEMFVGSATVNEIDFLNRSDLLLSLRDITESKMIEDLLSFIAGLAWARNNFSPINELLVYVSKLVGADYALVSEINAEKTFATTLSFVKRGLIADNISYDLVGTPCMDVVKGNMCIVNSDLQKKYPTDVELVKMKAESYVGAPVFDANNNRIGIVAVVHTRSFKNPYLVSKILQIASKPIANEIERLAHREHIRNLEERYKLLFLKLEMAMAIHDVVFDEAGLPVDFRFVEVNAAYENIVGMSRDRIIGRTALELWPNFTKTWLRKFAMVGLTRQSLYFDDFATAFGRYFKGFAFSPSEHSFVAVFQDITEHKLKQQELEEREDQLNKIFTYTQSALMLVNENAEIVQLNPAANELANKSNLVQIDGPQLGNVLKCIHSFDAKGGCGCGMACETCKLRQLIANTFFNMNGLAKQEIIFRQATDQGAVDLCFLVSSSLVYLKGRKHVLVTLEDVTAMKQLELALVVSRNKAQESDRLKTAFFNNLSHEIRTPLNGIVGFANLLKKDDLGREETKVFVDFINENSCRLLQIMNNVLELSQLSTGNFKASNRTVDLKGITERGVEHCNELFARKGIGFEWDIRGAAKISADNTALQGVLNQLLANAFKFTAQGEVRLKWYVGKQKMSCVIADTGIGIDKKDHDLIFMPFKQVEDGMTRSFGGVGIGLAIAHGYAKAMGGDLKVRSELGRGSFFRFSVPLN